MLAIRSSFLALALTLVVHAASVVSSQEARSELESRGTKLQCRKQAVGNLRFVSADSLTNSDGSDTGLLGSLAGSATGADAGTLAGFQTTWDIGKLRSAGAKSKRADKKEDSGRKTLSKQHSLHHHHQSNSKAKSDAKKESSKKKEKHLHHQLSESNKATKPQKAVKAVKADSREGQVAPGALAPPAADDGSSDDQAKGGKLHSTSKKTHASHTKSSKSHKPTKTHKSHSKDPKNTHHSATKSKGKSGAAETSKPKPKPEPASSSLLVLLAPIASDASSTDTKSAASSAVQPDTTPLFNFYSCSSPLNNVYGTLNGDGAKLVGQIRDGINCLARKDIKGQTYVVQQACFLRDNASLERQLWILDYTSSGSSPALRAWSSASGEGSFLLPGDAASPEVGLGTEQGEWTAVLS